jgi:lysophospholipase L1-like esterase
MSIRRFLIITATVVCAAIFAAPAQARSPREYYVALGDSISYGFQTSKALAGLPPSAFDTGYVDVVASRLRHAGRALDVVNYSCPGESTRTISRPCIWRATGHALHDDYAGPQLRTGLRFLRHHADRVPLITITLGGIDIDDFLATCPPGDLGCLQASAPAAIAAYAFRMGAILARLRAAAPRATLVVVGLYDPNITQLAFADPLFAALDDALQRVSAAATARFADVMPRFNPAADEVATLCRVTLLCAAGDAHPSDAGYRVIAECVLSALTNNFAIRNGVTS